MFTYGIIANSLKFRNSLVEFFTLELKFVILIVLIN